MPPCIPENFSTWLVDWSLVTGNTMPPRDPNDDDDDDDDEDDEAEPDDGNSGPGVRRRKPQAERERHGERRERQPTGAV